MEKLYCGLMSECALNEEKKRRERIEEELKSLMQVERQNYHAVLNKFNAAALVIKFAQNYLYLDIEKRYRCKFCNPRTSFKTEEKFLAHVHEDENHINSWALSQVLQNEGESVRAAYEEKMNWERRDRLVEWQRVVEKMDLSKDPFFTRDQYGMYKCSLCSTCLPTPRHYMFHTLNDTHQSYLAESKNPTQAEEQ